MERICKVLKQHELSVRDYTDSNGQPKQFKSITLLLQSGASSIYAEVVQEFADYLNEYPTNTSYVYIATLMMTGRSYTDSQGKERYQTDIRVTSLVRLV